MDRDPVERIGYDRLNTVGQTLDGARVIERGRMATCGAGEQREKRSLPDRAGDPIFLYRGKGGS